MELKVVVFIARYNCQGVPDYENGLPSLPEEEV